MRKFIKKVFVTVKSIFVRRKENVTNCEPVFDFLFDEDLFVQLKNEDLKPLSDGVAIYARVALDENNGLEKQIEDLKTKIAIVGDKSCSIYSEVASGIAKDKQNRKELYRLLSDAEKGLIKRLYVKSRDRIARDFVFAREITKRLNDYGVELIEAE